MNPNIKTISASYCMTDKIVNRALKVKLYPTQEQKEFLDKSLGTSRFFYNYRLNEQIEFYKTEIEPIKDNEKLKKKNTNLSNQHLKNNSRKNLILQKNVQMTVLIQRKEICSLHLIISSKV